MRIKRRRSAVILALVAAGAMVVTGVALAATASNGDDSDFTFKFSPNKVPKKKPQKGALATDLFNKYLNPGNANPGGAVNRTQIFLDDDFKINPKVTPKCNPAAISGNIPMSAAMAACGSSLVGKGTATASANGAFTINGCVLLFNGAPQGGKPTLQVFTRVQVASPSSILCGTPSSNNQGNATILLSGVVKGASGDYGIQLDINHITNAAAFPLTEFKTVIKRGKYFSGRCHDGNHKWNLKTTWTYNDNVKETEKHTQKCKVK